MNLRKVTFYVDTPAGMSDVTLRLRLQRHFKVHQSTGLFKLDGLTILYDGLHVGDQPPPPSRDECVECGADREAVERENADESVPATEIGRDDEFGWHCGGCDPVENQESDMGADDVAFGRYIAQLGLDPRALADLPLETIERLAGGAQGSAEDIRDLAVRVVLQEGMPGLHTVLHALATFFEVTLFPYNWPDHPEEQPWNASDVALVIPTTQYLSVHTRVFMTGPEIHAAAIYEHNPLNGADGNLLFLAALRSTGG